MNKFSTFLILTVLSSVPIMAQRILPIQWMNNANVGDRHISVGDNAMLFGTRQTGVDGDFYWDKGWKTANIYFYNQKYVAPGGKMVSLDSVSNIELRIDILNDLLEFNTDGGIRTIPAKYVSNIITKGNDDALTQFINPREFGKTDIKGFFELITTGKKASFLTSREIIKQAANYVPALGAGNQNAQLVKKDHFHLFIDGELKEIRNKKDLMEAMGSFQNKVEDFAKKEKLRGKSKEDLKAMVDYYNQI